MSEEEIDATRRIGDIMAPLFSRRNWGWQTCFLGDQRRAEKKAERSKNWHRELDGAGGEVEVHVDVMRDVSERQSESRTSVPVLELALGADTS